MSTETKRIRSIDEDVDRMDIEDESKMIERMQTAVTRKRDQKSMRTDGINENTKTLNDRDPQREQYRQRV